MVTSCPDASICNSSRVSVTAFVRSQGVVIINSIQQTFGGIADIGVRRDLIKLAPPLPYVLHVQWRAFRFTACRCVRQR